VKSGGRPNNRSYHARAALPLVSRCRTPPPRAAPGPERPV